MHGLDRLIKLSRSRSISTSSHKPNVVSSHFIMRPKLKFTKKKKKKNQSNNNTLSGLHKIFYNTNKDDLVSRGKYESQFFIFYFFFIRYESQSWQRKKNISVDIYIYIYIFFLSSNYYYILRSSRGL